MDNSKILIYDGSFNGFLTAIYVAFENRIQVSDIRSNVVCQNGLFSETETIFTDMEKAKRVWNGIQDKSISAVKDIYFAYLSEYEGIEQILYRYIRQLFVDRDFESTINIDGIALKVRQLAKNVSRVKERMESFIGFNLTYDEVYLSMIKPEFNVLPLISRHLRSRLPNQSWIVYDSKRKYGLYYDLDRVEIITLALPNRREQKKNHFSADSHNEHDTLMDYFRCNAILPHLNEKFYIQNTTRPYLEKKAV